MIDGFDDVLAHYERWWTHTNDAPLFYLIFPTEPVDYGPVKADWMADASLDQWSNWKQEVVFGHAVELTHRTGDWRYVEDTLPLFEYYAEVTGHLGAGYPFLMPMMGPGCLSAFISNFAQYDAPTIWLELPEPWDWEPVERIDEHVSGPFFEVAVEAVRRLVDRVQDRYLIGMPDLGGILDVLACLRGTNNLLMDTIDRPEAFDEVRRRLELQWTDAYRAFSRIIDPGNHGGYAPQMRWLSPEPCTTGICDFCAMIGPEMFERFVRPSLERDAEQFAGRVVYHLDGPGQLVHLDSLLAMEGVHAIQWVPGAGNKDTLDPKHDELYRRILDAGKKIALGGVPFDLDRLGELFGKFPAEAFFCPMTLSSREEAEQVLKLA